MKLMMGLVLFFIFNISYANDKALIYMGPGSCEDGCTEASVEMAKLAGLTPVIVTPETISKEIFKDAKIWIQPGGYASVAARALKTEGMELIRNFVKDGGGYVGFCAGGFLATELIGTTGNTGLGILPGRSIPYKSYRRRAITLEKTDWTLAGGFTQRQIYWEGGPYFTFKKDEAMKVEELGKYNRTGQTVSVRSTFGLGKVYVTGLHPEAPQWWRDDVYLDDKDGLDYDISVEMIKWAMK